jgi:hypothetical protein
VILAKSLKQTCRLGYANRFDGNGGHSPPYKSNPFEHESHMRKPWFMPTNSLKASGPELLEPLI